MWMTMFARSLFARTLMVLCLSLSLVAPKASAALAWMLPDSFQSVVICTGYGISVVTLDANGTPVDDTEIVTDHCLQGEATFHVAAHNAPWSQATFSAFRYDTVEPAPRTGLAPELRDRQSRAPPIA
jgi:hypothetical protein